MKVLIVTNMVPFVWGGAEELTINLHRELTLAGVDADVIRVPFYWEPYSRLENEIMFCKALKAKNTDLVIAMKFPAYHIQSDQKKIWLVHQFRQAYDLYDAGKSNIPSDTAGSVVRDTIIAEDNKTFQSARQIFSISNVVTDRLRQYNGFESEPLRVPLNDAELFTGGDQGDYFLAAGRVNGAKRQTLAVEAMRHLPKSTRLIVAGPPDSQSDAEELRNSVRKAGLENRVKLDLRFMNRTELANYVNNALAVIYLPFMEDSYGYVAMEAFEAGKPVITATDSGEVCLIVQDGVTGYVCRPEPEALANAMGRLQGARAKAKDLGSNGRELWRSKGINWASHIERLLS
jgi:glycosyltransferase involved in cell wall biosynthesis